MANILSTEDLTVFGGPAKIAIDLDFGPTGQRGSKIFIDSVNPNTKTFDETIYYGDLYINNEPTSVDYRVMYIYQSVSGINTWVKITNLIPNFYSRKSLSTFSDGGTTINIPLSDLTYSDYTGELTVDSFIIQHSIVNTVNPTVSNLSISGITESAGIQILQLSINATEYDGGTWTDLVGQRSVHLFISVV
jgi:hypothetical protein